MKPCSTVHLFTNFKALTHKNVYKTLFKNTFLNKTFFKAVLKFKQGPNCCHFHGKISQGKNKIHSIIYKPIGYVTRTF